MPRKGTLAKEEATKLLKQAFGDNYDGFYDNAHYATLSDGPDGEPIQLKIAISFVWKPITFVKQPSPSAIKKKADQDDVEEMKRLVGLL